VKLFKQHGLFGIGLVYREASEDEILNEADRIRIERWANTPVEPLEAPRVGGLACACGRMEPHVSCADSPRVIQRTMTDGIRTKDGAA
jgi:hypothetical protein